MATYSVLRHKVNLYSKSSAENSAGQKAATWTLAVTSQKCHYVPRIAITRTKPTYEETESVTMIFPANASITYGTRFYNLVDRFGNVIEAGPMQVDAILKHAGYSGKIHHLAVTAKRVIES